MSVAAAAPAAAAGDDDLVMQETEAQKAAREVEVRKTLEEVDKEDPRWAGAGWCAGWVAVLCHVNCSALACLRLHWPALLPAHPALRRVRAMSGQSCTSCLPASQHPASPPSSSFFTSFFALWLMRCREHLNIVFIGHVDAGKSTTAGQILFLTGGVDDRTIEKYEREAKEKNRESWYMAYIMDTNEEERAKVGWEGTAGGRQPSQ